MGSAFDRSWFLLKSAGVHHAGRVRGHAGNWEYPSPYDDETPQPEQPPYQFTPPPVDPEVERRKREVAQSPMEQDMGPPPYPPEEDDFDTAAIDKAFRLLKAQQILKGWQQKATGSDMRLDELAELPPELQHLVIQQMMESGELDPEMAHRLLADSGAPPPFESEEDMPAPSLQRFDSRRPQPFPPHPGIKARDTPVD